MLKLKFFFILSAIVFGAYNSTVAQTKKTNKVSINSKSSGDLNEGEGQKLKKDFGRNNSGVMFIQSSNGIVYKSHLRSFEEVHLEFQDRDGKVLSSYSNSMEQNVDYLIKLENYPKGEYLLRFEYENKLIVCNIIVS